VSDHHEINYGGQADAPSDDVIGTVLSIFANAIQVFANPSLIGDQVTRDRLTGFLTFVANSIKSGDVAVDELKLVDENIQKLVTEKRPPTNEEWAEWESRRDAANARINASIEE
jgi:hypothetical protein